MVYLFDFIKVTDENLIVNCVHHLPFDEVHGLHRTVEELNETGILVETLTNPNAGEYQSSILHVNPITKETWYEYIDIPKPPEQIQADKLEQLENQTAEYMVDLDFRLSNIELGL